ncbi:Agamous-like MADS-box protein AGL11 [Citrus sinensis]|uniref:Agamous-like MADS-box protein AGL11 n=1 Tax=Citrus sinensis TaxID=2711 RepID=A0ACB8M6Y0_CITSI|nr:Agamous-like MADS-box protein AGL11 [Citrus sinensis]
MNLVNLLTRVTRIGNAHTTTFPKGKSPVCAQFKAVVEYAPSQRVPKPCSRNDSREGTIFKDSDYLEFLKVIAKPAENLPSSEIQLEKKKAELSVPNKNLTSPVTCDPWKQYHQQESAKLRQQIQMSLNSNMHLMGDSLSSLTVKELKQLENRLERGITRIRSKKHEMPLAEIEFLQKGRLSWKMKACVSDQRYANQSVIAEMERFQQANTVTGQELNAIHALASRNFFSPAIIEGGGTAYSHPDKKILYLGARSTIRLHYLLNVCAT